jgi:predicted RNA methylase
MNSRRTGLLRLRHIHEHTEARGEEMADKRGRFQRLAHEDAAPRVVSSDNLFQTPEPIAAEMAAHFEKIGRWLEPSAGLGRLYRAIRARDTSAPGVLVDSSPECCRELYGATIADEWAVLLQGDFLEMDAARLGGPFDSIIMNPPFRRGSDIRHIRHAAELLAPGGRLVSLCAGGPRQRVALGSMASSWTDLPARSFRTEGTSVEVALIVIDNPGGQ